MAGGDCGGVHVGHILEVAGGGHGRVEDVVEGHVGGQHTPCDSQGNQDPTVDPFPHRHFPDKFQVNLRISQKCASYLSGQVGCPMLASERRM